MTTLSADMEADGSVDAVRQRRRFGASASQKTGLGRGGVKAVDMDGGVEDTHAARRKRDSASSGYRLTAAWALVVWALLAAVALRVQFALPAARELAGGRQDDGVFSEAAARRTVRTLAGEIGLRVVGSGQEAAARDAVVAAAGEFRRLGLAATAERAGSGSDSSASDQSSSVSGQRSADSSVSGQRSDGRSPVIDVSVQRVSGSHRFDFMGEPVIKVYSNVSNIVVHVSCGPECDRNAVLVNAHYDSTIVSPGATDDAVGVAVMLELLRIVAQSPIEKMRNSLVLLFNGAEETFQDASHGFITQHKLAPSIRAVLNLEAMGSRGKEILFQANSDIVLKAYRQCPHPHATIFASDIMGTGILLSDTDFRQFVEYGNLTGIDMAYFIGSYVYHTMLDVEENIQEGSIQHFGDNMVAMVKYLLFEADLTDTNTQHTAVFYDYLGLVFVHYSRFMCLVLHLGTAVALFAFVGAWIRSIGLTWLGAFAEAAYFGVGVVAGAVGATAMSVAIAHGFGNSMSWFSREWYPLVVFGGPVILGQFGHAFDVRARIRDDDGVALAVGERRLVVGMAVFWSIGLVLTTLLGLGSSFLCALHAGSILLGFVVDWAWNLVSTKAEKGSASAMVRPIPFAALAASMLIATPYGVPNSYHLLLLFVPLLGRIGQDAPVDIIIAIVTTLTVFLSQLYVLTPVVFRMNAGTAAYVRRAVIVFSVIAALVFASMHPFDAMHPKRIVVEFKENVTAGTRSVLAAHLDPARERDLVESLEHELGVPGVERGRLDTDRDWGTIFPVSHFIKGFEFDVTEQTAQMVRDVATVPPKVILTSSEYDSVMDIRTLHIECVHPGYIWTVLSFHADVVSWSIADGVPPRSGGVHHHTIRHVGGDGTDRWNMSLSVMGSQPMTIEISGAERDGFHEHEAVMHGDSGHPRMSHPGMRWKWSDRWTSAEILSRVEGALPQWMSGLYMGVVIADYIL